MKTLTDPVEIIVADALRGAGIDYVTEIDPRALHLDFYIPSLDLHIEVKQFHCDRTAGQIQRSDNIIVIIGIDAARAFARMITRSADDTL